MAEAIRLQKYFNMSGAFSRREAEKLIKEGRVLINGKRAILGCRVKPGDAVMVDSKRFYLKKEKLYLILNKPIGYVTTRANDQNTRTVYDLLPREYKKVLWPVGRLDKDSEGLLIMTNDGDLTQKLTHPSFVHQKEYEVLVDRLPTLVELSGLSSGVLIDDKLTSPVKIGLKNKKIFITMHEGRNRQIRRMFALFAIRVKKLKRIRVGKLKLTRSLPVGGYQFISRDNIF